MAKRLTSPCHRDGCVRSILVSLLLLQVPITTPLLQLQVQAQA